MLRKKKLRISQEFPVEIAQSADQSVFNFPELGCKFTLTFTSLEKDDCVYLQVHDGLSWKMMDLRLYPLVQGTKTLGIFLKLSERKNAVEVHFSEHGFTDGNDYYQWKRLRGYKWRVVRFKDYHDISVVEAWLTITPKSFLEKIGNYLLRCIYGQ